MPLPDRIHPSLLRIFQRSTPDDTIAFVDESYVAPEEDFSESFYILVGTAIKFEHLGSTRSLLRETAQSSYWHTTESMRSCDGRKKVEEMLKLCDDFECRFGVVGTASLRSWYRCSTYPVLQGVFFHS